MVETGCALANHSWSLRLGVLTQPACLTRQWLELLSQDTTDETARFEIIIGFCMKTLLQLFWFCLSVRKFKHVLSKALDRRMVDTTANIALVSV